MTQEEADQGKEVDMTFSVSYRYPALRTISYANKPGKEICKYCEAHHTIEIMGERKDER